MKTYRIVPGWTLHHSSSRDSACHQTVPTQLYPWSQEIGSLHWRPFQRNKNPQSLDHTIRNSHPRKCEYPWLRTQYLDKTYRQTALPYTTTPKQGLRVRNRDKWKSNHSMTWKISRARFPHSISSNRKEIDQIGQIPNTLDHSTRIDIKPGRNLSNRNIARKRAANICRNRSHWRVSMIVRVHTNDWVLGVVRNTTRSISWSYNYIILQWCSKQQRGSTRGIKWV